jgi:hypothetical protein
MNTFNHLPLEDLARDMFPNGSHDLKAESGARYHSQRGVEDEIKSFRSDTSPVIRVDLRAYLYVDSDASGTYFTLQFNSRRRHLKLTSWHVDKNFKLKLPTWLSFETLYDTVDVENSFLTQAWLRLRGQEGSFVAPEDAAELIIQRGMKRVECRKYERTDPDCLRERFILKIHESRSR